MGAFSDRMTATALRLLTQYGESVGAERRETTYDPATGEANSSSVTTYSGKGYPSNYNKSEMDGVIIQQDDILLVFSSVEEPKVGDVMVVHGKDYTAISVQLITAQGNNVVYKVQLRQ